jgi:hypothetical protein
MIGSQSTAGNSPRQPTSLPGRQRVRHRSRSCPPNPDSPHPCIQDSGDRADCPVYFSPPFPCPSKSPRKHLVNRQDRNRSLGMRFSCKGWSHRSCASFRKLEWIERLFRSRDRLPHGGLYCWTGAASQWGKLRKAFQRSPDGRFLKIATGAKRNRLVVLCSSPLHGAVPVDFESALRKLRESLWAVPRTHGRPVTCSKDFLPKLPRKCRWFYANEIPASDEHFESAIKALANDDRVTATILEPRKAAAWQFGPDVSEHERARINQRLFGEVLRADPDRITKVTQPINDRAGVRNRAV